MALMIGPPLGKFGGAEVKTKTVVFNNVRGKEIEILSAEEFSGGLLLLRNIPQRYSNSSSSRPEIRSNGAVASYLPTDIGSLSSDDMTASQWVLVGSGPVSLRNSGGSSSSIHRMDFDLEVSWVEL